MIKKILDIALHKLCLSKKRTVAFGVITILGTFFIMAEQQQSTRLTVLAPETKSCINTIIFDLGGVIFETSKSSQRSIFLPTILKNPSILYYLLTGFDTKKEFFAILERVPTKTTDPVYNNGQRMPQVFNDWMTGSSSLPELKRATYEQINLSSHPAAMKNLFYNVADFIFDTDSIVASMTPVTTMINLLKELKNAGYRVYILSNWDPFSFPKVKEKYAELFSYCDGIVVSGEENMSKPNPLLFQTLLERYSLNPQQCLFIDDEPYNVQAARELHIHAIEHTDPIKTLKELIAWHILDLKS